MASQVIYGENLGASLAAGHYVFRNAEGRLWYRVTEASRRGLLHFTAFRTLFPLTFQWEPGIASAPLEMQRSSALLPIRWELVEVGVGGILALSSGWRGTRWEVVDLQTGARMLGVAKGNLVLAPQSAKLMTTEGRVVATLKWENFSRQLWTHARVRIEVFEETKRLAAMALALARWVFLQRR